MPRIAKMIPKEKNKVRIYALADISIFLTVLTNMTVQINRFIGESPEINSHMNENYICNRNGITNRGK